MPIPGLYDAYQRWAGQTVWVYSDPHFGDQDLAAGVVNRPSDLDHVKLINACVGKKDTLICLGDVGNLAYVRQLRGYKVLIMGNHDAGATNYKRQIIKERYDIEKYTKEEVRSRAQICYPGWKLTIDENYDLTHTPFHYWELTADNCLFDEVYEGALIIGEKLILSHEPVDIPWLYNIHGHDHSGRSDAAHCNVCSDACGYQPLNLNRFLKSGPLAHTDSIHRITIDAATKRSKKRKGKK